MRNPWLIAIGPALSRLVTLAIFAMWKRAMPRSNSWLLGLCLAPSLASAQPDPNFDSVLKDLCPPFEPVIDDSERLASFGYSVLPPSPGYWCSFAPSTRVLVFQALKLDADATERPTREFLAHTFGVLGVAYTIEEADAARFPTLAQLVQAWTEQTRGMRMADEEVYVDFTPTPGFTHISSSVSIDDTLGADCVRYEFEMEERGNTNVPRNWVLAIRANGITCRHPDDPSLLIDVTFSERLRKGAPNPDAGAWEKLLKQAQATLLSLRFEPLDRKVDVEVTRGTPLPDGAPAAGHLSGDDSEARDNTYFETWHFQARAGERVRITMESESFDAVLILARLSDDGVETLTGSDDRLRGQNPRIDYRVPADGEYVLIATSYLPRTSGPYTIELERR